MADVSCKLERMRERHGRRDTKAPRSAGRDNGLPEAAGFCAVNISKKGPEILLPLPALQLKVQALFVSLFTNSLDNTIWDLDARGGGEGRNWRF